MSEMFGYRIVRTYEAEAEKDRAAGVLAHRDCFGGWSHCVGPDAVVLLPVAKYDCGFDALVDLGHDSGGYVILP